MPEDKAPTPRFTGAEVMLIMAALGVVNSLLTLLGNKLNNSEGSNIEAMEEVLESMKLAIELERKIEEEQNAVDDEDVNLDDWIDDSGN